MIKQQKTVLLFTARISKKLDVKASFQSSVPHIEPVGFVTLTTHKFKSKNRSKGDI